MRQKQAPRLFGEVICPQLELPFWKIGVCMINKAPGRQISIRQTDDEGILEKLLFTPDYS